MDGKHHLLLVVTAVIEHHGAGGHEKGLEIGVARARNVHPRFRNMAWPGRAGPGGTVRTVFLAYKPGPQAPCVVSA